MKVTLPKVSGILLVMTSLLADSRAAGPVDAKIVRVGEWTEPTQIQVPSDHGSGTLIRRQCNVEVTQPNAPIPGPMKYTIDLLYADPLEFVWIGPVQEQYFVLGRAIYGLKAHRFLRILGSRKLPPASDAKAPSKNQLDQFLENPVHLAPWAGQ